MTQPQQRDTLTLEQAWHFLMTQFAYRNPLKVRQAQLARRALRDIKRHRRGSL
jgi:hypothetical protein